MSKSQPCAKRCFTSDEKIKQHLKRLRSHGASQGFRVRTYYCSKCHAYHVTNHEKGSRTSSGRSTKRQKTRRLELKRGRSKNTRELKAWKESA